MKKRNIIIMVFIFIALAVLIAINYSTIRIISASRSYINGESEYSKGQKDALLYLSTYIQTRDTNYWNAFYAAIQIPIGDNLARHSLLAHDRDEIISSYFQMGRNNVKDIPDMIFLFNTFKNSFMKVPIRLWSEAEPMINELYKTGIEVHYKITSNSMTDEGRENTLKLLSRVTADLSKKESEFSRSLSNEIRLINGYLIVANIACLLLIVAGIIMYAQLMLARLGYSHARLEAKNRELIEANKELDTLVYSVSHDLRSPITSIKGLIDLSKREDDLPAIREFIGLIEEAIEKQDQFILEIFDFFKNKRSSLTFTSFSLKKLVTDIVNNNRFSPQAQDMEIVQEMELDKVYTDELRLKIIINNLVSNAIKYSDDRKPGKKITIRSYEEMKRLVLQVEDNGIGIEEKHINKIYNMFFVTTHANKGTGLGLYILKQNIEKLKGTVEVQSEIDKGTRFIVSIPMNGQ